MLFSTVLRRLPRTRLLPPPPRRTIFGIGRSESPSTTANQEEEFRKQAQRAQALFADKPEAYQALVKFAQFLQEAGVKVEAGKMPGPMQMMKLARHPKFMETFTELQRAMKDAGVDIQSKEFMEMGKALLSSYKK